MGRGHRSAPRTLKRRVAVRKPKKTVLVFCEGTRTEPEYLAELKRQPEIRVVAAVDIRIERQGSGSVPLTLVRTAVAAKSRAAKEEAEIDEFWCVFDVEWPTNHPNLREAIALAERNGIHLAVSNPCFELWLALHFSDHAAWLDNTAACNLRRAHDGQVDKGVIGAHYMVRRSVAAQRAVALDERHRRNGAVFPRDNPSSGMWRFLAAVSPTDR